MSSKWRLKFDVASTTNTTSVASIGVSPGILLKVIKYVTNLCILLKKNVNRDE